MITIIADKCKGCGLCAKNCPYDAIKMENRKAIVNDKCVDCNACVNSCKFGAIIGVEVEEKKEVDLSAYKGVWVFAEQREGKVMPTVFELLGEGKKLAKDLGVELSALLLCDEEGEMPKDLAAYGADKVILAKDALLKDYTTDAYTKVITEVIDDMKPEIFNLGIKLL